MLSSTEWSRIEQIKVLLDIIDEFLQDFSNPSDLRNAATQAKEKLEEYYPTTDGLVYIIGTSMARLR